MTRTYKGSRTIRYGMVIIRDDSLDTGFRDARKALRQGSLWLFLEVIRTTNPSSHRTNDRV